MTMTCEIEAAHFRECEALREERNRAALTEREKLVPRIRELEAENARLRAALQGMRERMGDEPAEVDSPARPRAGGHRPVEFRERRDVR